MSNDKLRNQQPALSTTGANKIGPPPTASTGRVPPLFRSVDWLTFLVTFAFVWIGYYFTLAPALTLEDSGELATGSFYAGIPHPPGYPVWTIYTWLWTLLPIGNVAWRVALGEATGGALAAGLLGLLVSRGSSMLMEGIEDLKAMAGRWESAICMVSGFVAGGLIGYNGFMWSQSVIVEVYSFSVASLVAVLLFLLRWIYAPHQRRYLYLALLFHGICFTNHQTLIVAAMGIEVAIAAADFRLGRYLFLGNSIIFICGLILKQAHVLTALEANNAIFIIFIVVGLCSIAAYLWFAVMTKETFQELCLDASISAFFVLTALKPALGFFSIILALGALVATVKFARDTRKLGFEWLVVMICGLCWIAGAAFYFYMPLAGMTNPPMQWGYPRTVEGFIHAFTRGQYEKTNPTNIIGDPLRFLVQLQMMGRGIVDEFSWLYAFLALVPFFFYRKLHRRERAWLIGITAIYLCLGVLLLILLNPPPDRAAQELVRVFFTASHTLIALLVGYGLALVAAYMATHYQKFRSWGLIGGGLGFGLALLSFAELTHSTYFGENTTMNIGKFLGFVGSTFTNKDQYGLPVFAGLMLIGITVVFVAALAVYRTRAPLAITLAAFALMPFYSVMTHWSDNEQRGHLFGYWFGHDMFSPPFNDASGKPLYPEMAKDAVLYGGTDPGRFCPTYMIFCDSFLPDNCKVPIDPKFDRRDVYIITQNALADGTYLNYIRAHYNRSAQIDPPFFQELARPERERQENYETNFLAKMVEPLDNLFEGLGASVEKRRRTFTSWFSENQFTDFPGFVARLKASSQQDLVSKFISENLEPATQKLLSGDDSKSLRSALVEDLNRILDRELQTNEALAEAKAKRDKSLQSGEAASSSRVQALEKEIADLSRREPLYTAERFKNVEISDYLKDFIKQNPLSYTRPRLNRLLLEAAYPSEISKSKGGVYPDREIYIASPEDSSRCFQDYLADAQRRLQVNQLRPGEDVKIIDNRVQVSGQVAVMAINGLITKVMFDRNPKNEFYVEESFPLEWMYRHLTPFGVIMKINREPLKELSEEVVRKDHEFWTQYSERLIGNWVTYNTPIQEIADFVEKVYLRRDFTGFKGDRKFIRDDQAQKAFSKLRSSIGGLYAWRVNDAKPGSPEQQRMLKEADFAFRQALAFCPYSPEAVYRYVNLLLSHQRFDEALIVVKTCLKLDPFNGQVMGLKAQLESFRGGQPQALTPQDGVPQLEKRVRDNPGDVQAAFNLASAYLQMQQTNSAYEVLDRALEKSQTNVGALLAIAQAWAQLGNYSKLEATLEKLAKAAPDSPEAWYDLAAVKATLNKPAEAIPALKQALEASAQRLAKDSKARDLRTELKKDPRFAVMSALPEFQKLTESP